MAYLSFTNPDGSATLVEVAAQELDFEPDGVVKAGVGERLRSAVAAANTSLEGALSAVVRANTQAFLRAVDSLPDAPDQVEVEFALTATGELSNLAVGKLSSEANYKVTLSWTHRGDQAQQSHQTD